MISKRGQEEMIGFVMIVVIVSIILVILLGILVARGGKEEVQESVNVYQFLESTMEYTSDCAISFEPAYSKIRDLIKECYENPVAICTSGEKVCNSLDKTLGEIFETSWDVGNESAYKGYVFETIYISDNKESSERVIQGGNCEGNFRGAEILIPSYPGSLVNSFQLCT